MSDWSTFDEAYVLGALPSDVGSAYAAWIAANPGKSQRLGLIVEQVRADFRGGLSANPNGTMDPDPETLHPRCVPHALTVVVYHLTLEMGLPINTSAQTAFINAQVYLRRLYTSEVALLDGAVSRSPSYRPGPERPPKSLGNTP